MTCCSSPAGTGPAFPVLKEGARIWLRAIYTQGRCWWHCQRRTCVEDEEGEEGENDRSQTSGGSKQPNKGPNMTTAGPEPSSARTGPQGLMDWKVLTQLHELCTGKESGDVCEGRGGVRLPSTVHWLGSGHPWFPGDSPSSSFKVFHGPLEYNAFMSVSPLRKTFSACHTKVLKAAMQESSYT